MAINQGNVLKPNHRLRAPAALFAILSGLLFLSRPVHAGVYATASVSDLQFRLIDLDDGDSVLPTYTLMFDAGSRSIVDTAASDASLGASDSASDIHEKMFHELSQDARAGSAQAHAEVTLQGVSATGVAADAGSSFYARASTGNQSGYLDGFFAINLSPRTALIVSVNAEVQVRAGSVGCNLAAERGSADCGVENVIGHAGLGLSYGYGDFGGVVSYDFNDGANVWASVPDQLSTTRRQLSTVFVNQSGSEQYATLTLFASVWGRTTPIPEASTTAMFALGLLGLAGVVRRRAAAASASRRPQPR